MTGIQYIKSTCSICGHNQCGVIVKVKDNKVLEVIPDKDDPVTEGAICSKGISSVELLYHPDRLKYPLVRDGERGSGRWRRASWDEALDLISKKLLEIKEKYGPESVVMARGTNRGSWIRLFNRFANAFGTPNWTESGGAQCYTPRSLAQKITFGGLALEWPDLKNSKTILVWGANPPATWPPKAKKIMYAKRNGAKIIAVDPVQSNMASQADIWLPVRPGSDVALALGMLSVIINEKLYDEEYVRKYTIGFDKLKERISHYDLKWSSRLTWVDEDKIAEAARLYATNRPSSIVVSATIDEIADPIQLGRSLCILAAITGNVDVRGGNIFPETAGQVSIDTNDFILLDKIPEHLDEKRLGADRYPLLSRNLGINFPMAHYPTVIEAILTGKPYPIKAMFIMGGNPALAIANSQKVEEALKKVEFLAVVDLFMSKTAEFADVVLPAASWLEYDGLADSIQATYGSLRIRQKVATLGEARSDTWIILELAKRMKLEGFWDSEEEYLNYILKPLGITFEEFRRRGGIILREPDIGKRLRNGFETPSGKIELYSQLLENWGFDPLPSYTEPFESPYSSPSLAEEYPYVLTTGRRVPAYFHTSQRNIKSLRKLCPDPICEINIETAKKLGISEGDLVRIETPRGYAIMRAKLIHGIHPRAVAVQHGWPDEANDNRLTDDKNCAKGIGSTILRGLLCRVKKA